MITRFKIDNFKSLVDFELPPKGHTLGGFTCLIGLNGAGKTTLLQAFDFIAKIATGRVGDWLAAREWEAKEIINNQGAKRLISFTVSFHTSGAQLIDWCAEFDINSLMCISEEIKMGDRVLLRLEKRSLMFAGAKAEQRFDSFPFEYKGSVLSMLPLADVDPQIGEVKASLEGLQSLELLSPQLMRRKAREARDIGAGGEKLSPFLDQLSPDAKGKLQDLLHDFYPQLKTWNIQGFRAGWKILRIQEAFTSSRQVSAGHINDGFLRVIAILSQLFTNHQMILLDEIENGINPALVEKLMDFLVGLRTESRQVIVTTHSPVILNFLEDDVAREGVILLYKGTDGRTRCARYFDQPETGYKLKALGPGEVFVDTDLTKLVARLAADAAPAPLTSGSGK